MYLDSIPEELLMKILEFTFRQGISKPLFIDDIYDYLTGGRRINQEDHERDWRLANGVCRGIRRIGKDVFFKVKPMAIGLRLAQEIAHRKSPIIPNFLGAAGEDLLRQITRHLVLLNSGSSNNLGQPSDLLKLPKLFARIFPRLRTCTLIYGHRSGHDAQNDPQGESTRDMPVELVDLLRRVGVPSSIRFFITCGPISLGWDYYEADLVRGAYPLLRMRASMLEAKEKKTATPPGPD